MPRATLPDGLEMYYEVDDLTPPWTTPETVILHHGVAKSGRLFHAWVPDLARHYRVVRIDARGFGRSTIPPPDHEWSLEGFARDIAGLCDELGVEQAHLIGETLGGTISLRFASMFPERVMSVAVCSSPHVFRGREHYTQLRATIERFGVAGWIERSAASWFAPTADPAHVTWMSGEMARSRQEVVLAVIASASGVDLTPQLADIEAPALVIVGEQSEQVPDARSLAEALPRGRLAVIPHVGGFARVQFEAPEQCARAWLDFVGALS